MSMSYSDNILSITAEFKYSEACSKSYCKNNYIDNNIRMILKLKSNNVIHLSIYKVDEIIMNFIKYVNDSFM